MIEISKDKTRLDLDIIHEFLTETYWAKGRTKDEVRTSIEHCLCFGVFFENEQIGTQRKASAHALWCVGSGYFALHCFA